MASDRYPQRSANSSDRGRLSEDPVPKTPIHHQRNQQAPYILSAGPEIQTPITIQASSLDFNTPAASSGNHDLVDPPPATANLETSTAQVADHQVTFSELKKQALIRTYLERVNPRYPFLHEETFLSWYQSWRDLPQGVLPAQDQWKSFFIKMAFAVSLLIAPQVSPEERHASNVSIALLESPACTAINRMKVSILDRSLIPQCCFR